MKIIFKFLVIMVFIFLLSCSDSNEKKEDKVGLIIPLYSYPTDEDGQIWNAVLTASESVPVAVIWGLVDTVDAPVYQEYVSHLQSGNKIFLYSYVPTNSGERPSREVEKEVDYYVNNFDIDGIFFDEVSNEDKYINYYKNLVQYAKQFPKIKKVIFNSSYAPVDFIEKTGVDILIIFENLGSEWDYFSKQDYKFLPIEQKAIIVSEVFSSLEMERIITEAVDNNIGYVYVTDKGYDFLPSYWNKEVNLIKEINDK